ncbi:MAG: GIY-YIG nuclease family protein [Planctomycetaceae bacterium]|nr:GIY-YIG nuclease family protein [Planctomycetaceae bacterium]
MPRKKPQLFADDQAPLREPFGLSPYARGCADVRSMSIVGTRRERRVRVRGRCDENAGVYGFVNEAHELIYVGMSTNLRKRLLTYFSSAQRRSKEARIAGRSRQLLWQTAVHPLLARLRELELIRRFRPAYNVEGHPWRMQEAFVVLVDNDAPWFRLQKQPPKHSLGMWGPIPLNRRTRAAVNDLNMYFRLRDCPLGTKMHFANQGPLFPDDLSTSCLRADTQTCLAPCIGQCSQREYAAAIRAASQFLSGEPSVVLELLTEQMRAASLDQKFERAGRLRDMRTSLERLDQHLRRFHDWMAQSTFVYPVKGVSGFDEHWLVVVRGAVREVFKAPSSAEQQQHVLSQLTSFAQNPDAEGTALRLTTNHFQVARVVYRWFRKYPETRKRCWTLRQAIANCRRRRVA